MHSTCNFWNEKHTPDPINRFFRYDELLLFIIVEIYCEKCNAIRLFFCSFSLSRLDGKAFKKLSGFSANCITNFFFSLIIPEIIAFLIASKSATEMEERKF